jgi:hypothetical protein
MSTSLLHGLSTMKSCPKLLDCCRNMVLSKQLDGIFDVYALPKLGGSSSNTQPHSNKRALYAGTSSITRQTRIVLSALSHIYSFSPINNNHDGEKRALWVSSSM